MTKATKMVISKAIKILEEKKIWVENRINSPNITLEEYVMLKKFMEGLDELIKYLIPKLEI